MIGFDQIAQAATTFYATVIPIALEAAIIGIAVWVTTRLGRTSSSSLRYGLLVLALAKFVVPPVQAPWSVPLPLPQSGLDVLAVDADADADARAGAASGRGDVARGAPVPVVDWSSPATPLELERPRVDPATPAAGPVSANAVPARAADRVGPGRGAPEAAAVDRWHASDLLGVLLLLHVCGALMLAVRRLSSWLAVQRIVRRSRSIEDPELLGLLSAIATRQGLRRLPRLVVSPDGIGPAAVGVLGRTIVLPERLVATAAGAELRAVIAHEVAHHRRGDLLVDWIVFLGSLVWWPHPVYALLRRDLVRVREDCCDDAAVLEIGAADRYCQSLLDAAATVGRPRPALPAVAHGSFSHPLGRRIRRLMNPQLKPSVRLSASALGILFAAGVFVIPAATTQGTPVAEPSLAESAPSNPAPAAQESEPTKPDDRLATATVTTQSRSFHYQINDNVRWGVEDGVVHMTSAAVDEFVERGLDRDFVTGLVGTADRDLTLDDLRGWVQYGVDSDLPGALEQMGVDRVGVFELLRLVWSGADGAYVRGLHAAGLTALDAQEISRLARYEVDGDYISDFRAQGYTDLGPEDYIRLSRYEVEAGYAGTYREAGYDLTVDEMIRLHRYEVDEDAVARLTAAGVEPPSVDDLVTLSRYEVGDRYIRAITEDGEFKISTDDLVRLKRYEVDPATAIELRDLGQDVSTDDLVRLSRYNVSLDYVRSLQDLGYSEPSVDDLVTLQRYEVDLDRIRALADAGYATLPVSDIVRLQRYDVDPTFIRELSAAGGRRFSVDQLVTLKRYEVGSEYILGMADVGMDDLSVDDLVRLKRYEVEPEFIQRLRSGGFEDLTVDRIIRLKRADG